MGQVNWDKYNKDTIDLVRYALIQEHIDLCSSRAEFARRFPADRSYADRYGVWEELSKNLPKLKSAVDLVALEALTRTYTYYGDLKREHPSQVRYIHRHNLEYMLNHMTPVCIPKTLEYCQEEALKYKSKKVMQVAVPTLYKYIQSHGWEDKCFAHMPKRKAADSAGWGKKPFTEKWEWATVYLLKFFNDDESFYKIGITGRGVDLRYSDSLLDYYEYDILWEHDFLSGICYDIELFYINKITEFGIRYNPEFWPAKWCTECFKAHRNAKIFKIGFKNEQIWKN